MLLLEKRMFLPVTFISAPKYKQSIFVRLHRARLSPWERENRHLSSFSSFFYRVLTKHLAGTIDEYMPCCQQLIVILENLI
jgi:hypothetical protein